MTSKTKIKKRAGRKENPEVKSLILLLQKQKDPIWHDVARYLAAPKRKSVAVNIEKINRLSNDSEIIIVPGKVLGAGELNHNIVLAALKFSSGVKEKIGKKANIMTIPELIEKRSAFKGINARMII